MLTPPADARIVLMAELMAEPVDFRRGAPGLARLVEQSVQEHPFGGDIFVFRAKRAERTPSCIQFRRLSGHLSLAPAFRPGATMHGSEQAKA
jgi:transposase